MSLVLPSSWAASTAHRADENLPPQLVVGRLRILYRRIQCRLFIYWLVTVAAASRVQGPRATGPPLTCARPPHLPCSLGAVVACSG